MGEFILSEVIKNLQRVDIYSISEHNKENIIKRINRCLRRKDYRRYRYMRNNLGRLVLINKQDGFDVSIIEEIISRTSVK